MDVRDVRPFTATTDPASTPPEEVGLAPSDGFALPLAFLMVCAGSSVAWWCSRSPTRRIIPAPSPANAP